MFTSRVRPIYCVVIICVLAALGPEVQAARVIGEVVEVAGDTIVANFNCPVRPHSMMMVLSGEGESVAGMAVSERCSGSGPYQVRGEIQFVSDAAALSAGKMVYVNSLNAGAPAAEPAPVTAMVQPSSDVASPINDLKLYYFAAGENVGYGAFGLGYERTIRITKGISVEFDGGVTGLAGLGNSDPNVSYSDQLIKSASGRAVFDIAPGLGIYGAYRWNEGRGDVDDWNDFTQGLQGKEFVAASDGDDRCVELRGIEYGISLRPARKFALSLGYIPRLRADYAGFGVRNEPGFTGELRFGTGSGAIRLRGLASDDYWHADLGITIR